MAGVKEKYLRKRGQREQRKAPSRKENKQKMTTTKRRKKKGEDMKRE